MGGNSERAGPYSLDSVQDCFGVDLLRKHQLHGPGPFLQLNSASICSRVTLLGWNPKVTILFWGSVLCTPQPMFWPD